MVEEREEIEGIINISFHMFVPKLIYYLRESLQRSQEKSICDQADNGAFFADSMSVSQHLVVLSPLQGEPSDQLKPPVGFVSTVMAAGAPLV